MKEALAFFAATLLCLAAQAERIPFSVPLASRSFVEIAQRKGVTVYKDRNAHTIRLGAEAKFPGQPERVWRAVLDYQGQLGRLARLSESRVLVRNKQLMLVYQRLNLPVISDRDFVIEVRWGQDREVLWVTYHAVNGVGPAPRRGVVRVSHHEGSWQFKPVDGGRATLARFEVIIDLGGWLPMWMAKAGSGKEMPEVFTAIGGMLSRPGPRTASAR